MLATTKNCLIIVYFVDFVFTINLVRTRV